MHSRHRSLKLQVLLAFSCCPATEKSSVTLHPSSKITLLLMH